MKCQQANPESLGRPTFRYIDIDSVDNIGLRITEPKSMPVAEAPSRARKLVRARDVLFSTVRPYLKNIAIVPPSLDGEIASTGFGVMRADVARAMPEYLFAVVSNQRFVDAANDLTTGASYPAITENQLFDLEIPLPPLEEQRRIVAEIEGYQKVLDGARQILAGYRPSFEIDPDWPTQPLGEAATISTGGTPSKANLNFWKGDIPWVSPKDMKTDVILDTEDHVSPEAVREQRDATHPKGTVLCVVRSGILQHTLPVAITGREVCFNQDINAITPNPKVLDAKFLFYLLKTRSGEILRDGIKGGVTVQSFHNGFFKSYEIPCRPWRSNVISWRSWTRRRRRWMRCERCSPLRGQNQRVLDRVWGNGETE